MTELPIGATEFAIDGKQVETWKSSKLSEEDIYA